MELKNLISLDYHKKRYARANVYDAHKEIGYQAKRGGISAVIRKAADLGAQLIENSADVISDFITETLGSFFQFFLGQEIAQNLGIFAGTVTKGIAGIASIGVAAGISAAFTQMDHIHQKQNLRDLYADELGAKLGKPARSVTVQDMEMVAKENPVLGQELSRAHKQRNFAVPLAVLATLSSFAVTGLLLPQLVPAVALTGVAGFLMKMPISMATYMAVKLPLQALGSHVFGLFDETPNDRIVDIKRAHEKGIEVKPEDLLPVFAKSNQTIDTMIVNEFGGHFEALPPDQQIMAVRLVGTQVPLEELARDINNGSINATELLFASVGQQSGVARSVVAHSGPEDEPKQPAMAGKSFQEKLALSQRDPNALFTERLSVEAASEALVSL